MRQQPLFAAAGGWDIVKIVKIKLYKKEVRDDMNNDVLRSTSALKLNETELLNISGGKLSWNDLGFYLSGLSGGVIGAAIAGAVAGTATAGLAGTFLGGFIGGVGYWIDIGY